MTEPCENCEVLREENRSLQTSLDTHRKLYEQATSQLRIQGTLESVLKAHEFTGAQLKVIQDELDTRKEMTAVAADASAALATDPSSR